MPASEQQATYVLLLRLLEVDSDDIRPKGSILVQRALRVPRKTYAVLRNRRERAELFVRARTVLVQPRHLVVHVDDRRIRVVLLPRLCPARLSPGWWRWPDKLLDTLGELRCRDAEPTDDDHVGATPPQQILELVRRSDSIAVKSEGTRVLVNAVKSLWSTDPKTLDEEKVKKREAAMEAIVTEPCVSALARLIGRSKRYPTLINEGVVALTLVSTHPNGGTVEPFIPPRIRKHSLSFTQARWCWTRF